MCTVPNPWGNFSVLAEMFLLHDWYGQKLEVSLFRIRWSGSAALPYSPALNRLFVTCMWLCCIPILGKFSQHHICSYWNGDLHLREVGLKQLSLFRALCWTVSAACLTSTHHHLMHTIWGSAHFHTRPFLSPSGTRNYTLFGLDDLHPSSTSP